MKKSSCYADRGHRPFLRAALVGLSIAMLSVSCGGDNSADTQGAVGQPCYPDDTCDEGLYCISGVCTTGIATTTPDAGVPQFNDASDTDPATPDGSVAVFPDGSGSVPSDDGGVPASDGDSSVPNDTGSSVPNDTGSSLPNDTGGPTCTDDCLSNDPPRCVGVRQQVCGNHDADSCLEWSPGTPNAQCVFFDDPKEADWGTCSEVCGPGEQTATRKCVDLTRNPAPDQALCNGDPVVKRPCNVVACSLTITQQPASAKAALGGEVTFTVVAQGPPAPTYQWYSRPAGSSSDWVAVQGQTNPSMGVAGAIAMYNSEFLVQAVNKTGWKNSAIVKVLPEFETFDIAIGDCGDGWNGIDWICGKMNNDVHGVSTLNKLCTIKTGNGDSVHVDVGIQWDRKNLPTVSWWVFKDGVWKWHHEDHCGQCNGIYKSVKCYK